MPKYSFVIFVGRKTDLKIHWTFRKRANTYSSFWYDCTCNIVYQI